MNQNQNQSYDQAQQSVPPQTTTQPGGAQPVQQIPYETIFCTTCGQRIAKVAIACPFCGTPVYQNQPQQQQVQPQQIIINNSNNNVNTLRNGGYGPKMLNKWTAFFLCLLFGWFGAHKFYEGRIFLGIVYLLSFGLFGFGWVIDTLILLFKPNPYYV